MIAPVIHIFFNGQECYFPPGSAWEKFKGLDAARTFVICKESWERNGWEVRRLSTLGGEFTKTPFASDGEVSKSFHWYPFTLWQFIAKAKAVAALEPERLHWFGTIDVINYGFTPGARETYVHPGQQCVSFQREHFSLALFASTHAWLYTAEKILLQYDRGELHPLNREYVSDETILRNFALADLAPGMTFANNTERGHFWLCHFSRSAVPYAYNEIPLS